MKATVCCASLVSFIFCGIVSAASYDTPAHYIQTTESQAKLTSENALKKLKDGNSRFLTGNMRNRDYILQTKTTAQQGQAPFAVVLSCMDSRGSAEIIFDQGIGDIFSLRIAGNILNQDIIGSMEYATEIVKAKIIVVMGHTHCGAVEAACKNVTFGNLTPLLQKIKPAVINLKTTSSECNSQTVNAIAKQNVIDMLNSLPNKSEIIAKLIEQNNLMLVGAIHDLNTGKVNFFDKNGNDL